MSSGIIKNEVAKGAWSTCWSVLRGVTEQDGRSTTTAYPLYLTFLGDRWRTNASANTLMSSTALLCPQCDPCRLIAGLAKTLLVTSEGIGEGKEVTKLAAQDRSTAAAWLRASWAGARARRGSLGAEEGEGEGGDGD